MATITLACAPYATVPPFFNAPTQFAGVGNADLGVCMSAQDATYLQAIDDGGHFFSDNFGVAFTDPGPVALPTLAVINSVQFSMRLRGKFFFIDFAVQGFGPEVISPLVGAWQWPLSPDPPTGTDPAFGLDIPAFTTLSTAITTVNPLTTAVNGFSTPWTRSDLFLPASIGVAVNGSNLNTTGFFQVDYAYITVDFSGTNAWYFNPVTNHYQYTASNPGSPWVLGTPSSTPSSVVPAQGSTLGGN